MNDVKHIIAHTKSSRVIQDVMDIKHSRVCEGATTQLVERHTKRVLCEAHNR
jgi:hypothetical protein